MTGVTDSAEAGSVELAASGPAANVAAATATAQALKTVLDSKDLVVRIRGKDHITAEAWLAMASISGLTTRIEWTRPIGEGENAGWEARCIVKTADGREVGAAESMCVRAESGWRGSDDYAIRSMAQTRATSRALRPLLGFVGVLAAGTETTTPAEEVVSLESWAQPIGDATDVLRPLRVILEAARVTESDVVARDVGRRSWERCGRTVPLCVLAVLEDICDALVR